MKNRVVIGLGSNLPEGAQLLQQAAETIARTASEARFSTVYRTAAVGNPDAAPYFNAVGILTTEQDPETLRMQFKTLERQFGRTSESKQRGEVPLDIDIVCWNNRIVREADFRQAYFRIGWEMIAPDPKNKRPDPEKS